jgi:regulator of sigma E protease
VHEFGHLLACKLFAVYAPVYSIGFGPALWKKQIGSTVYQLSPLPLGGYTQIVETPANQWQKSIVHGLGEKFFNEIPYWQKVIIMLAGILFNLIFAWLIFFLLLLFPARATSVQESNESVGDITEQSAQLNQAPGIVMRPTRVVGSMLRSMSGIFSRRATKERAAVGGPLMFFSESFKSLNSGFRFFCMYIAGFSVSLVFFNLLPLPLLDGGRVVMVTVEAVLGYQIPEKIKVIIYFLCLFLIVMMISLLSARDIGRLFRKRRQ